MYYFNLFDCLFCAESGPILSTSNAECPVHTPTIVYMLIGRMCICQYWSIGYKDSENELDLEVEGRRYSERKEETK